MKAALLLASSLLTVACIRPKPDYNGIVESVSCGAIQGWAFDWNRPTVPVEISIYDGEKLVVKTMAGGARPDLQIVNKSHGYAISPPPAVLFDGQPHDIHVRYADSKIELPQSPKPLRCPDAPH